MIVSSLNPDAVPPLPDGDAEFDLNTAWWMSECSKLAYLEAAEIDAALRPHGFEPIRFFDRNGTQAFLARHPVGILGSPVTVLAFRGTERNLQDILTDIRFCQRKTRDGRFKVHDGFLTGIDHVWDEISEALTSLPSGGALYFTGHSLGGALATLAASRHLPTSLYTFGSPRVAGAPLARHLKRSVRMYRMVHGSDIVPQVPLWGYRHVGRTVFVKDDAEVSYPANKRRMATRFCRLLGDAVLMVGGMLPWSRLSTVFDDHRITHYVDKLGQNTFIPTLRADATSEGFGDADPLTRRKAA